MKGTDAPPSDLGRRDRARRLVVDSIDDLAVAAHDQQRFREYMYSLTQRCARRQISLLMTHEVPVLTGLTRLSELGLSHLSDNVVLLQYEPDNDTLRRSITILKTRASAHELRRHVYTIGPQGITLAESGAKHQTAKARKEGAESP